MLVDLLDPVLNVVKRGSLIDRVGEYNYQCSFVKGGRKVFKFLLPCSVPNLQFDLQVLHLKGFDLKVDTDCRGICGFETVVAVAQQNIGLSDSAIANNNRLHYEIAVCFFLRLHNYINYQTLSLVLKIQNRHICFYYLLIVVINKFIKPRFTYKDIFSSSRQIGCELH